MTGEPLVTLPAALATPGARREARFLLGVDGGATKTLAAVLDLREGSIHLGHGGPSNEDAVGAKAAVEALLEAAQEAIDGAGTETGQLSAAVLAIAGTDTDSIKHHIHRARGDSWTVVNDVVGAWATATGCSPGVAAIAGTGSNVFGVGEDGRSWRTGGWGHLLGDEGSGYWLGVESIRAALRDRDASGPPTRLGEEASAFFDVPSIEALASLVYSKPLTKGEIAAFAVRTAKLADEGDDVARELFARGAQLLGGQIVAVIAQTGLRGRFPVGLIGSAYKAGPVFMEPLEKRVRQDAPQAQISLVEMAPVGGSLLLAARACGQQDSIQPAELTRLIESALQA
jgi:glucosamine kinase